MNDDFDMLDLNDLYSDGEYDTEDEAEEYDRLQEEYERSALKSVSKF